MSIAYFPCIYPDELLYSALARYYTHSGYMAYIYAAEDLFINTKVRPDVEFITQLRPEFLKIITKNISIQELVLKHTMFPYYARFLDINRRKKALEAFEQMSGNYYNLIAKPIQKDGKQRYLRYCPICVKEDRGTYGETYWHRQHQMLGVNICPIHHVELIDSSILLSGEASPSLVTAEQEVQVGESFNVTKSQLEVSLAEYVAKVFAYDMDMENSVDTGKFFHAKLSGTKYVSVRGEQRKMRELSADFKKYYKEFSEKEIMELWQLEKLFINYRIHTLEVCQLAMFLNVSESDLVQMKLPAKSQEQIFDEKVHEMINAGIKLNMIARQLGVSSRTIREIKKKDRKLLKKEKYYSRKCGAKPKNWSQIDRETLPLVKGAVQQLLGEDDIRPKRVTKFTMCKLLNLPSKRFDYLPLCRTEILKHQESQEQYWAREIVWAVNKIQGEGKIINWKQIRELTNIKKVNLLESIPYLYKITDADVIELVKRVL